MRDGLGQLLACDAMLMGRNTYEGFAKLWPGRIHPWADRLNAIPKYVFSSKLEKAEWNNTTIVRGDVVAEVTRLKQQEGGDLLISWRDQQGNSFAISFASDMSTFFGYFQRVNEGPIAYRGTLK